MEETDVDSKAFWKDEKTIVLSHPDFREESLALEEEVAGDEDLEGGFHSSVVFRSSGTSGEAKYVCLSKRALLASAASVNRHLRVTPDDRWLRALPLFHVGGFGIHARAYLEGNAVIVFDGKWDAARFASRCGEERITLTSLVPAQVHDLVAAEVRGPESMRAVVVGGGTLAEELGNEARALGWPVLQSYGLTEAGSQVATAELESLGAGKFRNRELPLLDIWKARLNEDGVLELSGSATFRGYLSSEGSPGMSTKFPWFSTGDRVTLDTRDDETFVTFEAREGDVVKVLGELVCLPELRERLDRLGDPAGLRGAVALAAVPDDRRGVRLVLARTAGADEEAIAGIVSRFNEAVRGFERIGEIREVEAIPRTGIGKIAYGRLVELLREGKGPGK